MYLIDKQGPRKLLAPSYAGISSLWRVSQHSKRKHYLAIHEAHQRLRTHVRIAPNYVSISDPQAANETYGHGADYLKYAWYDGGAGEYRHMG